MKITYFNYEWDPSSSTGASTHISELTRALERIGHRVRMVHGRRRPDASPRTRPSPWLWEPANYLRSIRSIRRETEILAEDRPDAVLIRHALRFSSIIAARRLGLPVVLEVNAPVPYEMRRNRPEVRLLPGVSQCVERMIFRAADAIFVVSSALRDYAIRRGVRPERVRVIPNGADVNRFRPEAADPHVRARFPGRLLVGFAGSFARFHAVELLERVLQHPQTQLVLIGDGPAARDLRARGGERVTLLGRLPHDRVPGILAAMDVLVAPYVPSEFFYFSPVKLFEYMASGRAVLAARLGQIADVVDDGHNGMLYNPRSPDDFALKLEALLSNPELRASLGAQARRTIENNYTWEHNAQRVSRTMEEAAYFFSSSTTLWVRTMRPFASRSDNVF